MAVYFSIILVIITGLTGMVWLADKFYLAPQRKLKLTQALSQCQGELSEDVIEKILEPSAFIDTPVQIFPVIAFVLILRSFLYEPFQIPSGSMMPTLLDGDFILVNKFNYGLKDPVARNKFVDIGLPERGDVVVFKYPNQPQIDYIKRVIGLPGDRIFYQNKTLYIQRACKESDKECPKFEQVQQNFTEKYVGPLSEKGLNQYTSTMPLSKTDGTKTHNVLINTERLMQPFCTHAMGHVCQQSGTQAGEFLVPKGHYFVMGDNRDNSLDGRFWGFVPEENLVGQAVAIWMSFDFERTSDDWLPHWVPTGVRFSRLGAIN